MANAPCASAVVQSRAISRGVEKCSISSSLHRLIVAWLAAGAFRWPACRGLAVLLGGADHELVNNHVPGPGHDEPDGLGDVHGLQPGDAAEALVDLVKHLRPVVAGQLGLGEAGLDPRDPDVP